MKDLAKLIRTLKKKKLTIAVAESCSGGYLAYLLTKIPGSSKVFKAGIVVYSLDAKNTLFKIPKAKLEKSQGVSREIGLILAKRVAKKLNSDLGASIVGFAGPDAKGRVKPGTVHLGISYRRKTFSKKIVIKGNRDSVRKESSRIMIKLISQIISK